MLRHLTIALIGCSGCALVLGIDAGIGGDGAGGAGAGGTSGEGGNQGGGGTGGALGCEPFGGAPPEGCGSLSNLRDDFSNSLHPQWDPAGSGSATITGSGLDLLVDPGEQISVWSDYAYSTADFELILNIPLITLDTDDVFSVALRNPADSVSSVWVQVVDSTIELKSRVGTVPQTWTTRSYAGASDAHWRFRRDGSDIVVDTSADGAQWVQLGRAPADGVLPGGYARLVTTLESDGAGDVSAVQITSINGDAPDPEPWCPAHALRGHFDGNLWVEVDGGGCTFNATSEQITIESTETGTCGAQTSTAFDLTDDALALKLTNVSFSGPGSSLLMSVTPTPGTPSLVKIQIFENTLILEDTNDSTATTPYDVAETPYVRLRHTTTQAGNLYAVDVSADGRDWTFVSEFLSTIEPNPVTAGVAIVTDSEPPVSATFGEVNCAPE